MLGYSGSLAQGDVGKFMLQSLDFSVSETNSTLTLLYKYGMEMKMRRLVDAKQSKILMQSIKMCDVHVYYDTVPVLAVRRPLIAVYHLPHHSSSV